MTTCLVHGSRPGRRFLCWPETRNPLTFYLCPACRDRWQRHGVPMVPTSPEGAARRPRVDSASSGVAELNVTPESASI